MDESSRSEHREAVQQLLTSEGITVSSSEYTRSKESGISNKPGNSHHFYTCNTAASSDGEPENHLGAMELSKNEMESSSIEAIVRALNDKDSLERLRCSQRQTFVISDYR